MELHSSSENLLIERLRLGDEEAFEAIYNQYAESLLIFAESKLYSLEESRDVIQELFLSIWLRRAELRIQSSLKSYLYAMAKNRVIDQIRRNMLKEGYAENMRQISPAFQSLEDELYARELSSNLDLELSRLPDTTREVFRLSRKEGKSNKEIAEQLNLSEQTVKNNISKALKHLRNTLRFFFQLF